MKVDPNFNPGYVYIIYGENDLLSWADHAYKIGMTIKAPERRRNAASSEVWHYRNNLKVIHQISVDNARVVEKMFHERFRSRSVVLSRAHEVVSEWFKIDDRLDGVCAVRSIYVSDALQRLANDNDVFSWWKGITVSDRRNAALELWKHPLTRVEWDNDALCAIRLSRARYGPPSLPNGVIHCDSCQGDFVTDGRQVYCLDCRSQLRRARSAATRRHADRRERRIYEHCEWCRKPLPDGFGPFCSRECVFKHREYTNP